MQAVPLTSRSGEVWVVLSHRWLCSDLLGPLMSYEHVQRAPASGRLGEKELKTLYPSLEPRDVALLLEMLHVCNIHEVDGKLHCDVPWLNATAAPASLWGNDEGNPNSDPRLGPLGADTACGGLRLHAPKDLARQLVLSFPDVQLCLGSVHAAGEELGGQGAELGGQGVELAGQVIMTWHRGVKVRVNKMAAVLRVAGDEKGVELMLRGPSAQREALFHLQEELCSLVYCAMEESCPGLYLERHPISALDLRRNVPSPVTFAPADVFRAHLDGKLKVSNKSERGDQRDERLVDLLAYGSSATFSQLTLGPDLPVSLLPLPARRRLAALLDEPPPTGRAAGDKGGRDWAALAACLGVPVEAVARSSVGEEGSNLSKTDCLLALWARKEAGLRGDDGRGEEESGSFSAATVRVLRQRLAEIGRNNAVTILTAYTPLYAYTASARPACMAGE